MAAERKLEAFDELIGDFRKLDVLRSARLVAPRPEAGGGASNRFGPHAGAGMIMKRDAAFELGGAAEGSCSLVMATADERLVREGCISLTGDDLADLPWGRTFPFGQVLMVAGADLGPEDVAAVEEAVRVRDWIRGYQVRSVPGEVFVRVAAQAMREGLGFADVGRALSANGDNAMPGVGRRAEALVNMRGPVGHHVAVDPETGKRSKRSEHSWSPVRNDSTFRITRTAPDSTMPQPREAPVEEPLNVGGHGVSGGNAISYRQRSRSAWMRRTSVQVPLSLQAPQWPPLGQSISMPRAAMDSRRTSWEASRTRRRNP